MVEVLPMYAAQVQSLVLTAFKREVATVLFSLRHNLWKKTFVSPFAGEMNAQESGA